MRIARCGIWFTVGYVSCNVLCGGSCRPGICKATFLFSFRMNCFMNSRPKDINNNSTTILCCRFVAMCGVCKSFGESFGSSGTALGALGKLWELWESSRSSPRALGALGKLRELWECSGRALGELWELWGSSGEVWESSGSSGGALGRSGEVWGAGGLNS